MINTIDQQPDNQNRLCFVDFTACHWEKNMMLPFWELNTPCLLVAASGTVSVRIQGTKQPRRSEPFAITVNTTTPIKEYTDILLHRDDAIFLSQDYNYMVHSESGTTFFQIYFTGGKPISFTERFTLTDSVLILQYISFLQRNLEDPDRRFLCDACLSLIVGEALLQKNASEKNASLLCGNILRYIGDHADRPMTLNELSDAFSYSSDHIARVFKQYHPEGIKQYIVCERINRIKLLLLTTDLPMKELAMKLNFTTYKQFHKFFTYHEHMSPTEFRKLFDTSRYHQKST